MDDWWNLERNIVKKITSNKRYSQRGQHTIFVLLQLEHYELLGNKAINTSTITTNEEQPRKATSVLPTHYQQ